MQDSCACLPDCDALTASFVYTHDLIAVVKYIRSIS